MLSSELRRENMEIRTEPLPWKHKNLLLLGDEDEKMIARYLDRGTMYVLE